MAANSKIEWTDSTWNPVTGCTKVSTGCKNCYAERIHPRFRTGPFNEVKLHEHKLAEPLHWKKPRNIFVCSRSDLFHPSVPDMIIHRVFALASLTPWHTYQILTKRPERMLAYSKKYENLFVDGASDEITHFLQETSFKGTEWRESVTRDEEDLKDVDYEYHGDLPLPNVWLGVSCEDQKTADERIPLLFATPAAIRFASCEPLLGPINLDRLSQHGMSWLEGLSGRRITNNVVEKTHRLLDWVIVGGESGPHARPTHPNWVRSLRDQCREASVPFFFKQWGEWIPASQYFHTQLIKPESVGEKQCKWMQPDGSLRPIGEGLMDSQSTLMVRIGKKAAGRVLDGELWDQYPETK